MPPRIVQLDEEDDDVGAAAQQQTAWERAYEADRCVAFLSFSPGGCQPTLRHSPWWPPRAWEELEEDEFGRLKAVDPTLAQRAKRQRTLDQAAGARIRRGMIRYCLLCVDLSAAVNEVRTW
jgi:hypothetical protein